MQQEPGDEYLRRLSSFIRTNERKLAEVGPARRRSSQQQRTIDALSYLNPLGWLSYDASADSVSSPSKPVVLLMDSNRLFYVLMRIEALGIDVGTLDVQIESPSRPMNYSHLFPDSDKSDTISLASLRSSLSAISTLSLGSGWWGRTEPPSLDAEVRYIYSCFTKLPALVVKSPGDRSFREISNEPPNQNALPLDAFKNLQSLECVDIDPRVLLGWDRLAESLRSLKIKKSGLEDISDIFIGAVVDDQARRAGSTSRKRRRRIPRGQGMEASYVPTRLPTTVLEEPTEESPVGSNENYDASTPPPSLELSSLKWAFLQHLSLSDNALTCFPTDVFPYLTSVVHLDLSSNLFVSIPSGLGSLHNLISLNLSDNMIDSVLGIYSSLGQVLCINLSHNRLESICGLERLPALERVDLRHNFIEESAEIGRLAVLPNITAVWVAGNPLVELEEGYRITCFDHFQKEGKSISLDGSLPGFYEKRHLVSPPSNPMPSVQQVSATHSPPVVAVGHSSPPTFTQSERLPASSTSPQPGGNGASHTPVNGKLRKKRAKRIVDFDAGEHGNGHSVHHVKGRSDGFEPLAQRRTKSRKSIEGANSSPKPLSSKQTASEEQLLDSTSHDSNLPVKATERASSLLLIPQRNDWEEPPDHPQHRRSQTEFMSSSYTSALFRDVPQSASTTRGVARRSHTGTSPFEASTFVAHDLDYVRGEMKENAEVYRKKIEALKKDMGDGWLKVFTQSQLRPLNPR